MRSSKNWTKTFLMLSVLAALTTDAGAEEVEPMRHPLTQERGFWVPRQVFLELEKSQEVGRRCEEQLYHERARYELTGQAFRLVVRTATVGLRLRDRCFADLNRCTRLLTEQAGRRTGDSWWVRGLTAFGGAAIAGGTCWLANQ